MTREPHKRPAYEPAAGLVAPTPTNPRMARPASTVAGSVLVLLRAAAGIVWVLGFVLGWSGWVQDAAGAFSGDASDSSDLAGTPGLLTAVVVAVLVGVVFEATMGLLILSGRNGPRVLVMLFSVGSITIAFVGWWAQGQDIRLETTFLTLALDILILLALSSRSAAAYARRHEKRGHEPG